MRAAENPLDRGALLQGFHKARGGITADLRQVGEGEPLGGPAAGAAGRDEVAGRLVAADDGQNHRPDMGLGARPPGTEQATEDPDTRRHQQEPGG